MGQGYSLTTLSAGSAGIDVPELADVSYEKSLGDARFMKAIRARHRDGLVVTKVVMKPYASMKFSRYIKEIMRERKVLTDIPNALGYHRAFETSSNGYLIRQYIYNSVYDRMSTRPFLEEIEKKWLAFQLLCALRDCHSRNVYHGDIKTENTLVTSWNWLYLTDFSSSFKPTFLPEDNPADFSFFFDISGRRTCYLAPERFLSAGEQTVGKGGITWAMDVFSAGCVIAELFLESPIFNLSQLFNYRKHEFDPTHILKKIEDEDIRELVSHMIQVEPEMRYSADEYLNFWRRKAFPEYFYDFLHQYMFLITDPSSGKSAITAGATNLGESDDRIERVYYDFDKISFFLGYGDEKAAYDTAAVPSKTPYSLFPLHLNILHRRQIVARKVPPKVDDGTLLFLSVVTSALRSTARSTARIRACDLLLAFAENLTDEAKLDRALPYVVFLINDRSDSVKSAALRTLTQLISLVSTASPVNAYLFPEYILPKLELLTSLSGPKPRPLARITYAACITPLADAAARFLDVIQALKAEGSLPTIDPEADDGIYVHAYQNLYDVARADLLKFFESLTKTFLTDPDPNVRRAFLGSVSSLCVFFGSAKASDVILSHLNTYLNDKDWELKCAFFETIVGVATYVGSINLEEFMLPLMIGALSDPKEYVVEKVLRSLSAMAQLGLFQRSTTWELIDIVAPFTMHPNIWIREAAALFLASTTKYLSIADCQCIVKPKIDPYLRISPTSFLELSLLDALKKPLSRIVFEMAVTWATKVDKGIFWKPVQQRISSYVTMEQTPITNSMDFAPSALAKIPKTEEDQQWIARLRSAGMSQQDEFKLLVLRVHIFRMAKRKTMEEVATDTARLNKIISLKDLDIMPATIFFDYRQPVAGEASPRGQGAKGIESYPQTISDALLDASTIINASPSKINTSLHSNPSGSNDNPPTRSLSVAMKKTSPRISSPLSSSPGMQSDTQVSDSERETRKFSLRALAPTDQQLRAGTSSLSLRDAPEPLKSGEVLRHKGSAIDLLQRKPLAGKANAETSTSPANATGKVNAAYSGPKMPFTSAQGKEHLNPTQIRIHLAHSYRGQDPSILKLLDSLYLENFPGDGTEFGPVVTPIERRQWDRNGGVESNGYWRPEGSLVATFGEHTAAITRIAVSPDHSFFITGSDDGTVKIWDTARLERNITHRSRQTYRHAPGTKVTSLGFIENTHCFVTAATDGSIHIIKVDCVETSTGNTKYGKISTLREWQLPSPFSHAVWIVHFRVDNQSILHIATNTSQIHALDLKTMSILYTLDNPVNHGTPTCFCIDNKRHWLLLGTSHGILDLWDLRFRLRVKAWAFPGGTPIHRVALPPFRGTRRRQVCIAGGTGAGDVTVWDLEKMVCKEVYSIAAPQREKTDISLKTYTPWYPDGSAPGVMLTRFAESAAASLDTSAANRDVRAMVMGARAAADGQERRHGFFVAAGPDRKVRFWDMDRVEASCVVNGLDMDEKQPTYVASQLGAETVLCEERTPQGADHDGAGGGAAAAEAKGKGKANVGAKRTANGEAHGPRPSKSTVVSLQQQQLLRTHLDSILDVALLEYPAHMVVSVDRSGVVMVFK